jgi:hypothetical protein
MRLTIIIYLRKHLYQALKTPKRKISFATILPSVQTLDAGRHIERWQEHAGGNLEDDDTGIVLRLVRACLDLLSCLLTQIGSTSMTKREKNILRRCHNTLKLWAHGHGVWESKLDHVLEHSRNLQNSTLAVLNPLCKVLSHGTLI